MSTQQAVLRGGFAVCGSLGILVPSSLPKSTVLCTGSIGTRHPARVAAKLLKVTAAGTWEGERIRVRGAGSRSTATIRPTTWTAMSPATMTL